MPGLCIAPIYLEETASARGSPRRIVHQTDIDGGGRHRRGPGAEAAALVITWTACSVSSWPYPRSSRCSAPSKLRAIATQGKKIAIPGWGSHRTSSQPPAGPVGTIRFGRHLGHPPFAESARLIADGKSSVPRIHPKPEMRYEDRRPVAAPWTGVVQTSLHGLTNRNFAPHPVGPSARARDNRPRPWLRGSDRGGPNHRGAGDRTSTLCVPLIRAPYTLWRTKHEESIRSTRSVSTRGGGKAPEEVSDEAPTGFRTAEEGAEG